MKGTSRRINRTFNQRVSVKTEIDTQEVIESMRKWQMARLGIDGFEMPSEDEQSRLIDSARLVMIKAVTRGFVS